MTDTAERPARALSADVCVPARIDLDDELHLRRFTPDDLDALHEAIVASFAELHPWMPWCKEPVLVSEQREFLERADKLWEGAEAFGYALCDASGELLATISLMDRVGPGALEIGYWRRSDAPGRGLITRATKALTELGLSLPGIERIEIHCDAANVRSAAVPQRLGYRLGGEHDSGIDAPGESGRKQVWVTP